MYILCLSRKVDTMSAGILWLRNAAVLSPILLGFGSMSLHTHLCSLDRFTVEELDKMAAARALDTNCHARQPPEQFLKCRREISCLSLGTCDFANDILPNRKPGLTGRGMYELKPECAKEFNLYFYHFSRAEQSKVRGAQCSGRRCC